jgi:hypothetical protein
MKMAAVLVMMVLPAVHRRLTRLTTNVSGWLSYPYSNRFPASARERLRCVVGQFRHAAFWSSTPVRAGTLTPAAADERSGSAVGD